MGPGVLLNIRKQRNGDYEGVTGLRFDKKTYRYRSARCLKGARNYLPYESSNLKAA